MKNQIKVLEDQSILERKLWTDEKNTSSNTIRGIVPLPEGYKSSSCSKCGSYNIKGILLTPTSDEADPNIVCLDCGYWCD